MAEKQQEEILRAAAVLFARLGYHATGVRAIAEGAAVNVAMVSYYFGGKLGVLNAILDHTFALVREELTVAHRYGPAPPAGMQDMLVFTPSDEAVPPPTEEMITYLHRRIAGSVRAIVTVFQREPVFARVAFREIFSDHPDLNEAKARHISSIIPLVYGAMVGDGELLFDGTLIPRLAHNGLRLDIVGPAFASMVFSHFLFGTTVAGVTGLTYDDAFLEEYIESITAIFLNGFFARGLR